MAGITEDGDAHVDKMDGMDYGSAYGLVAWNSSLTVCRLLELGLLPPIKGLVVEVGAGCGS